MNRILKILCGVACAFVFCFLAIGYATLQDELKVTGSVSVQGYKPMAELSCADIDGYEFDHTTGVVTIKERYYDSKTGINYIVTGIAENGFSQTKIQEEQVNGTFADVSNPINATDITGFDLPRYLVSIGNNAFKGLANINTFTVNAASETFKAENNILFNADKTMIVRYPSAKQNTYYTVPEYVTSIRSDAFCDNSYCTAIVTTLYHEKAWGLPEGIMLNTSEFLDTITNITGDVQTGYTVYLQNSLDAKTVVLQGNNDPGYHIYREPANVEVQHNQEGNNYVTIASTLCTPCTQHNNYSGVYLSSWQNLAYTYLTDDKTLEIHNCKTAIVGGMIYQWVGDDDADHKAITNDHLYNLPSNAGEFNFLPEYYASWNKLTKSSVKKVKVADSIKPDTLIYGTYTSGGNVRNHTWFNNMTNCTEMDLAKLDTSNITDMSYMFINCQSLQRLDLSTFDTSKVTTMFCMFYFCYGLTELNLSGPKFDTSNVEDMSVMFSECKLLTSLNLSHFDTKNVTNMRSMFYMCEALSTLNISNFNTINVTDMSIMFAETHSLVNLNVSSFKTQNAEDMSRMFENCSQLRTLDISTFDTSKVTDMSKMFKGSHALKTIFVSNTFTLKRNTIATNMFFECGNLLGGNGTTYDSNYVNKTYACIDGKDGLQGYFTCVHAKDDSKFDDNGKCSVCGQNKVSTSSEELICSCEAKCTELTEACEVCKTDITNCGGTEAPIGEELTCSCETKCTELTDCLSASMRTMFPGASPMNAFPL